MDKPTKRGLAVLAKKKIIIASLALVIVAGVVGVVVWQQFYMPEKAISGPISIVDGLGRNVIITKYPERIVSLAPSNTEILFALGLGDKVVGVTTWCEYPPEAKTREKIGSYASVDMERVVNLKPDLTLADPYQMEVVGKLESLDLTVIVLDAKDIEEILRNILLVGKVTGQEDDASKLVAEMEQRMEVIAGKTSTLAEDQKPTVLYIYEPFWIAGFETFADDLIKRAGGINIASDVERCAQVSLEFITGRNPDVIICSAGYAPTYEVVVNEPAFQQVNAVKNSRVYSIDYHIAETPGPRIVDALEQIAKFIHPEMFD